MKPPLHFRFANPPRTRSAGHEHDVALLLTEGRAVLECDGEREEVVAPSLFFIPAGAPHGFADAKDAGGWAFTGRFFHIHTKLMGRAVMLPPNRAEDLSAWFRRVASEQESGLPYSATAIDALSLLISVELARVCHDAGCHTDLSDVALDLIAEESARPIRPRDIARRLGVTPAHLSHLMTRKTGRTLTSWIAEARVNRVKEMLLDSERTIAEVAEALEYGDATQLAREFKRVTGVAPGAWRAKSANRTTN